MYMNVGSTVNRSGRCCLSLATPAALSRSASARCRPWSPECRNTDKNPSWGLWFLKVYVSHWFIYCTFAFVVVFFIEVLMREGTLLTFPKVSRSQQNRNFSCVHDIYIVRQWLNVWSLNVQTELCSIWLKKILAWNPMRWEGIISFCDHFIGLVGCRCLQGTFDKATFSHVTGEASGLLLGLTSSWSFCNLTWLKTRLPSLPHTALSSSLFREKSWAPVRIPKQSVALQK